MGVRIDVYAVDVSSLRIFTLTSLHNALWCYAEQRCTSQEVLQFYNYIAYPGKGVFSRDLHLRKLRPVSKEETANDIPLKTTVADFYAGQSSIALHTLFACFGACAELKWIIPVIKGQRRWWIGSLLYAAEAQFGTATHEYQMMTALLQKVLRGYDCGKVLPQSDYQLTDFPLVPEEEIDSLIAVWTLEDMQHFLKLLDVLTIPTMPVFKAPVGKIGIAPTTDKVWDEWVREVISQYQQLKTLQFKELNLISFIS